MLAPTRTARSIAPRRPAEPLVVYAVDLAPLIVQWIERHDDEHPAKRIRMRPGERSVFHFSAARYLCLHAEITGARLRGILEEQPPFTYLSIADNLLQAMDEDWRLSSGLIPVFANPLWPKRRVLRTLQRQGCDLEEPFWSWDTDRAMP